MRRSLTKKERLKKSKDFKRILSSSTKAGCSGAKLAVLPNFLGVLRLGIVVTKKFGNAVQRNRTKRQIKEIFRLHKNEIKPGFDLVFLIYSGEETFEKRSWQILSLVKKVGLEAAQYD